MNGNTQIKKVTTMNNLKCPFCGQELTVYEYSAFTNVGFLPCEKCRIEGTKEMWEALIRTHKELEQSETCCSDWEKQALDYKTENIALSGEFDRTRKALDKGMKRITGLNNMIELWYKLLQSDKDTSTKYAILKSAISAYVENKGGDNE